MGREPATARPFAPASSHGAVVGGRVLIVARRSALLICLASACLLAWSVPALGLGQRGHVYGFSFGSSGERAGQFAEPAGVAVDEASGDVYVVDHAHNRIEQFGRTGEFIAAWGWGVTNGNTEYEVCTSHCRAGIPGAGKGQFKEPGAIAVDNSPDGDGEVYVDANGAAKRPDIERFPADGEKPLGKLPAEEEGRLDGVAVDRQGTVWVYRGEEEEAGVIEGFSAGARPVRLEPSLSSPLACPKPGLAVDAGGENFYVDHELLDGEEECPTAVEAVKAEEGEPAEGKDARPVVTGKLNAAEVLATGGTAISELDRQNTTGVAVDQASGPGTPLGEAGKGDVYVDNATSVAAFSSSGATIQRFGSGEIDQGMGVAVDAKTGDVYVVDGAGDKVEVFEPEPAGVPSVEGLSAFNLSSSEAQVSAQVDPDGADTHYYFQFGTVDCVVSPSACTDVPAGPGVDLGGGFGAQSVSATLQGLQPGTTYYYRVLASNAFGMAEGSQSLGSIDTLPSSLGVLADGRAWELVSPAEKDGSSIEALAKEGGLIQAAVDGSAVTYVATGPVVAEPEGNRAPESTQVLSARSAAKWSSEDIVTPHRKGEGIEGGEPAEYRFFSEDLSLSLVEPPGGSGGEPLEAPPLAPGASEKTLYVRDSPPIPPAASEQKLYGEAEANRGFLSPGLLALVTPLSVTAETQPGEKTRFGGKLNFLDATADLSDVVFESEAPLLAGSGSGLYEWEAGGLTQLVSVLPEGAPAESPALGGEGVNVRNAVSEDGGRVFFTAEGGEGAANGLYMRDTRTQETIQVNAAQGVVEPTGEESEVAFQAATKDGSKVFFSDTAPLTVQSTQRQHHEADLYECEVVEDNGKLKCDLTDLTPLPSGGSADVLNVIPGISEDGSDVYFVANGVLAAGAKPGHCVHESLETPPADATCNLYLSHNGAVTFIAALSNEDSGDWGSLHGVGRVGGFAVNRQDLTDVTSRVSPDGEYLAFMSSMPLTGYDNIDAKHAAEGVRDQEVYVYDAATGLLVCASCNPNGPSTGVLDTPHSGEGVGLVVDRREDWTGEYLAGSVPGWTPLGVEGAIHQPRYLSNSGRLFFNSPDQLVAQAPNAKEDVYEYEPDDVGSCGEQEGCVSLISSGTAAQESAFLDASENGENVFFLTAQPLVAADRDTDYDIYDARVCTSSSPCLSSEASSLRACETSKSCRPETSPQPTFGTPATASSSGPGNTPRQEILGVKTVKPTPALTRAQLLAKALKVCRKDKKKRKRAACEKQARKRYPAKAEAKKPKPTEKASQ